MNVSTSYKVLIEKAEKAEKNEQLDEAMKLYKDALKIEPSYELPYDRLMIIYRKQKNYKEELKVINEGIKFFQKQHENKQQQLSNSNKKIVQLSNALMKSVGLKDKKGKNIYYPEPIPKWQKRKQLVEKKMKR
jgi:tetratricopeptide (TPR) repeat protein